MDKLKFVCNIEIPLEFRKNPEIVNYEVLLNKGSDGWNYYYNDLYVRKGAEYIYRSFDGSHGIPLSHVKEGFEGEVDYLIEVHDIPYLADEMGIKEEIVPAN